MSLLRNALATLTATVMMTSLAFAQTAKPTAEEAKALSLKAAEEVRVKGPEAMRAVFNSDPQYKYGEIYVTIIDYDGVYVAFPPRPEAVGKSVLNVKDADGKYLVQDMISTAKKGEGWLEYRWLHPVSNKIEPKITYVKNVPERNVFVFVGVYK